MFKNLRSFDTTQAVILTAHQVLLLICLPFYFYYYSPSASLLVISFILVYATALSITVGYHRLYSHRTFRANPVIEWFLLFFGSMALQQSVLRWSHDHRIHHAKVDTDEDPYAITKGFWYAHYLWLLEKPIDFNPKVIPDLLKNKLVVFQDRYYAAVALATNLICYLALFVTLGDWVGTFMIAIWARIFTVHHVTWSINSLAHWWGEKPFSKELSAVDNYIIALISGGEGYHNYHHTFANDYRNGICWYHFDPSKWIIWTLSKVGLTHGLKTTNAYTIKKKIIVEDKNRLVIQLSTFWKEKKADVENQVEELSEKLLKTLSEFTRLKERYKELKKTKTPPEITKDFRSQMNILGENLKDDWQKWSDLYKQIMQTPQSQAARA